MICAFQPCAQSFGTTNNRQRFCSVRCRSKAYYAPKRAATLRRKLERRRAMSMGFDGRTGGPRYGREVDNALRKDGFDYGRQIIEKKLPVNPAEENEQ